MDRSIEQRYAIKFCFRLGKTASETFVMIREAYKEDALSRAQVFRWFHEFKNGRESVEDMERSGRPSTSRVDETVAKVKELLDLMPNSTKKSFSDCTEPSNGSDRTWLNAGVSTTTTLRRTQRSS